MGITWNLKKLTGRNENHNNRAVPNKISAPQLAILQASPGASLPARPCVPARLTGRAGSTGAW